VGDGSLRDNEARSAFADIWCAIGHRGARRHRQGRLDRRAGLAAAAIELGLVDELRMFRYPILVGGGTPFLPPVTEDVPLDLIETRTFGSRVIYERYRRVRDDSH
jgi:hypothetical protein